MIIFFFGFLNATLSHTVCFGIGVDKRIVIIISYSQHIIKVQTDYRWLVACVNGIYLKYAFSSRERMYSVYSNDRSKFQLYHLKMKCDLLIG